MTAVSPEPLERTRRLAWFETRHAVTVVTWINSPRTLRWVAPSTPAPLTPAKVAGWLKTGGEALVLLEGTDDLPIAYGELNPMRTEPDHYGLGHVIVAPERRGQGVGKRFVRGLLRRAFYGLDASRVSLIVFPDNEGAIRCYRAVGFRYVREEHHPFGRPAQMYRLLRYQIGRSAVSRAS